MSDATSPDDATSPEPPAGTGPRPVLAYTSTLGYATPMQEAGGLVTVARCATAAEAEMRTVPLHAAGIPYQVQNTNTVGISPWASGWVDVELQVRAEDAAAAADVLRRSTADDLEPVDDPPDAAPEVDADGRPVPLAVAATFDNVRSLRQAATLLASARIDPALPKLAPRGDRPPGEGKRFVLRVHEDDLDRAQALLDDAAAEAEEEDDPRCPKCASHRVYPFGGGLKGVLARTFGFGGPTGAAGSTGFECLACHHRGPVAEFSPGGGRQSDDS